MCSHLILYILDSFSRKMLLCKEVNCFIPNVWIMTCFQAEMWTPDWFITVYAVGVVCSTGSYTLDLDTFSPTCFLSCSLSHSLFLFSPFFFSAVFVSPPFCPFLCVLLSATWTIWTGYPRPPTSQLSRMSWGPESKPQALWRRTSHSRTSTSSENFFTVNSWFRLKVFYIMA